MNYHLVNKLLFFVLLWSTVDAKVTIFSHYFGQPEFIKYQYLFFKKNLQDEYEFIVVEDSNNPMVSKQIRDECKKFGIKYINIPRSAFERPVLPHLDSYVGGPSFECSIATQYIYDNYVVSTKNTCVIMDNDIFLLSPFSIEEYLGSNSFAYVHQNKGDVDYMLPNFLIVNPSRMAEKESLNFNMGIIKGNRTDSGGFTHFYLQKYREFGKSISVQYLHNTPSPLKQKFVNFCPTLFTSESWSTHYFIDKETFLHIRMGSNWSRDSRYSHMMNDVKFLFYQLLSTPTPTQCVIDDRNIQAMEYVGTRPTGGITQLQLLQHEGLRKHHYVLEVGCGALMTGIPLMSFLKDGHYVGIDPNPWLMNKTLLIAENQQVVKEKDPLFINTTDFDASSSNVEFDYVFAHSIMSHAADWQLSLFFEKTAQVLKKNGKVIFSIRLTEPNEYGNTGAAEETHAQEWQYPGCSFFDKATVIQRASQWFSKVEHRKNFTAILTADNPHAFHDWFVLTK